MTIQKKLALGISVSALLIAGVLYETVAPNHYAHTYNEKMRTNTIALDESLTRTGETTSRAIFTKRDITLDTNLVDLAAIQKQISETKQTITTVKRENKLTTLPLSGYFGAYKKAQTAQSEIADATKQAAVRLADYEKLVAYLTQTNKIDQASNKKFTTFSSSATVSQEETVAGLKNNAQVLRGSVNEYKKLDTPEVMQLLNATVSDLTIKIADALEQEAQAIVAHDDAKSKQAWDAVNSLQDRIADVNEKEQAKLMPQSVALKPITDIANLTDQIKL
jgi:hypothetical protein